MCEKLCTLIENQSHCIKNHKFLIVSVIEHVFTQVVPVPKPRGVSLAEDDLHRSTRSARRADKKKEEAKIKEEEKKKKMEEKIKKGPKGVPGKEKDAKGGSEGETSTEPPKVKIFGDEEVVPDFEEGKKVELASIEEPCMWDEAIYHELQVDMLLTIQRISEHFAAAAMSIQQSRSFDGSCVVVPGCLAAIADAIMRKAAIDEPNELCCMMSGKTVLGRQLGVPGFGISIATFATQVLFNSYNFGIVTGKMRNISFLYSPFLHILAVFTIFSARRSKFTMQNWQSQRRRCWTIFKAQSSSA